MEKIALDTITERLLLKRTRELIRFVPYDVFVRIEQIVNEAINNHYVYRYKLEELLALLQEVESQKDCEEDRVEQRASRFKNSCMTASIQKDNTVFYNQMYDYEVVRYKKMVATVYKGNIIKNLIMDCQSYTKYRPNETTGGIFVSWRRKEELPTGA